MLSKIVGHAVSRLCSVQWGSAAIVRQRRAYYGLRSFLPSLADGESNKKAPHTPSVNHAPPLFPAHLTTPLEWEPRNRSDEENEMPKIH